MKELNLLERSIVSPFINEEDKETISIYPGAFKPPHRGHLAVLEKANTVADKTIVLISSSPREDVEAEESLKIWEMYTKDMPNVEVKFFHLVNVFILLTTSSSLAPNSSICD